MGVLRQLQEDVQAVLIANPSIGAIVTVHRHGDMVTAVESACNKYGGTAVIISLLGHDRVESGGPLFKADFSIAVWSRSIDQTDEGSPLYYDDLVEEIIKSLHLLPSVAHAASPDNVNDCRRVFETPSGKLLPIQTEELRAYSVYELTISTIFELQLTNN